jgi:hypothetical protein
MSEKPNQPHTYRIIAERGGKTFTVEIADKTGTMKLPGFRSLAAADEWVTEQMRSDAEIGGNVWVSREQPPVEPGVSFREPKSSGHRGGAATRSRRAPIS